MKAVNSTAADVYTMPYENGGAIDEDAAVTRFGALLDSDEEDTGNDEEPNAAVEGGDDDTPDDVGEDIEEDVEGDEPDEEPDESEEDTDDEDTEADLVEITVDGETVKVPLDELKKGYSRTADYTRKTQAVAEERRAAQTERQQAAQLRESYTAQLTRVEEILTDLMPAEPDWDTLRVQNPAEYAAARMDFEERKQALVTIQNEKSRAAQENAAEQDTAMRSRLKEEGAKLLDVFPEWKDKTKYESGIKAIRDFAMSEKLGFTEAELETVQDHRLIQLLNDAMQYHALQGKRVDLRDKVKKVQTLRPGASTATPAAKKQPSRKRIAEARQARARLAETGSVQDAAAAIERFDF